MARFDHLTGLPNRSQFADKLQEGLVRARRSRGLLALLFIDIDHFKTVNDTLGHAAGDAVLVEFARRLSEAVRATDLVARLAGDEFVVLVEQLHNQDEATIVAGKIGAAMRPPITLAKGSAIATASIGACVWRGTEVELEPGVIMACADEQLYAAKRAGRDTYRLQVLAPELTVADADPSLVTGDSPGNPRVDCSS